MIKLKAISKFCVFFLLLLSCKKRDKSPLIPVAPPDNGEVITTVKIIFTDTIAGSTNTYYFADLDGPGGKPAFYGPGDGTQSDSVITLNAGKIYNVRLLFLNESVTPADTVSGEIAEEGEVHFITYDNGYYLPVTSFTPASVTLSGGTEITYSDADVKQKSIGLLTRWKTGTGYNLLRISLKHLHDGKENNVMDGETDLEVYFKLKS